MASRSKPNTRAIAQAAAAAATAAAAVGDSAEQIDIEDLNDDGSNELLEALESFDDGQSGIVWELYCSAPFDRQGLVRKMSKDELPSLRDELLKLGPGSYQLKARSARGRYITNTSRMFKVSSLAKPPEGSSAAPRPNTLDPLFLIKEFEDRDQKRRDRERSERWELFKVLSPLLAPIGIELAKGLFNKGNSVKELAEALVAIKSLGGEGGGSDKAIEAMFKGVELARDMGGDGGKGRTWQDVLMEALKEVAPMAKSLAERRAPAPAAPAALPNPQQLNGANGHAASTENNEMDMVQMMRPLLERLAADLEEFAINAADPGLASEALLAKVPRLVRSQIAPEQLREWLNHPQWWDFVIQFRASLAPYQAYVDDVRLDLLQQVDEQMNGPKSSGQEEDGGKEAAAT